MFFLHNVPKYLVQKDVEKIARHQRDLSESFFYGVLSTSNINRKFDYSNNKKFDLYGVSRYLSFFIKTSKYVYSFIPDFIGRFLLFDIFEQKATEIASFDGENPIQNIFSKLVYLILFILLF